MSRHPIKQAMIAAIVAAAQIIPAAARAEEKMLSIELNKLEPVESGCRVYVVVTNASALEFKALKLDLVLFQTDGVIGKRFALDLAPLKANKRMVKLFDIAGLACEAAGSILVNDVMACETGAEPLRDCLKRIEVSSLAKVQLMK